MAARQRRYVISMAIRTVCFVAAVAVGPGWLRWVLVAGAVFLPLLRRGHGQRRKRRRTTDSRFRARQAPTNWKRPAATLRKLEEIWPVAEFGIVAGVVKHSTSRAQHPPSERRTEVPDSFPPWLSGTSLPDFGRADDTWTIGHLLGQGLPARRHGGSCCGTTRRSTRLSAARRGWRATSTGRRCRTSSGRAGSSRTSCRTPVAAERPAQPPMADIGRSGWRNDSSSIPWPGRLPSIAMTQRSAISSSEAPARKAVRRSDSSRAKRQLRT